MKYSSPVRGLTTPRPHFHANRKTPITRGRKISEKITALVVSSTRKATVDELDSDYIRYGDGHFIFKDTLEDMTVDAPTPYDNSNEIKKYILIYFHFKKI